MINEWKPGWDLFIDKVLVNKHSDKRVDRIILKFSMLRRIKFFEGGNDERLSRYSVLWFCKSRDNVDEAEEK